MLNSDCRITAALLSAIAFFGFAGAAPVFAGGQFKRFPETISPDGAYALAWAPASESKANPSTFTEVPYSDESFDEDEADNYLIDVAAHKIIATIPDFGYFSGPQLHKNRASIEVGWSPDVKGALAIYGGRWSSDAVVWIEPKTRRIVSVQKQLEEGFRSVLHKKEPKLAQGVSINFENAVIPKPGILVIEASGTIPKEDETNNYQLKFKISGEGEKVRFQLQGNRVLPEDTSTAGDAEEELNKVYGRLRAKLPEARRQALRDEQKKWLELREEITDADCKSEFTGARTSELQVRLEQE
jgi:hypothetical protein